MELITLNVTVYTLLMHSMLELTIEGLSFYLYSFANFAIVTVRNVTSKIHRTISYYI